MPNEFDNLSENFSETGQLKQEIKIVAVAFAEYCENNDDLAFIPDEIARDVDFPATFDYWYKNIYQKH